MVKLHFVLIKLAFFFGQFSPIKALRLSWGCSQRYFVEIYFDVTRIKNSYFYM